MFVNNTFHGTTVDEKNLNAMNIKFWLWRNASLLTNIPWKFCTNRNIFHRDIKENASGCFCLMFRQKKHPIAFSFISRWKMSRFVQNFDLYKIFRVCLGVIRHSVEIKIKYSLLLLTRKNFIKCLSSVVKPIISQTCKHDVKITSSVGKNI